MISDNKVTQLHPNQDISRQIGHQLADDAYLSHGGGNGGGGTMLEARVAKLEAEISYIRRDVDELRTDAKSISQNMIIAIEKLENIKATLDAKPSADAVDNKISKAKLTILLGVPAIMTVITGIYKIVQHYI